jgi:hypothetical protein
MTYEKITPNNAQQDQPAQSRKDDEKNRSNPEKKLRIIIPECQ